MLRQIYTKVYLSKPYTSRISNSEKYVVCKGFNKSVLTTKIISKLEDQLDVINKNNYYQILDLFTDIKLSDPVYNAYKQINLDLSVKQYVGINNIIKFINLDNYNGVEFNQCLDKQIMASHFWNNLFLEPKLFGKIIKYFKSFNFVEYKKKYLGTIDNDKKLVKTVKVNKSETKSESEPESESETKTESESKTESETKPESENKKVIKSTNLSRTKSVNKSTKEITEPTKPIGTTKPTKPTTKPTKPTKLIGTTGTTGSDKLNQKGGKIISYPDSDSEINMMIYDNSSIGSSDEIIGHLDSDHETNFHIDLNNI